MKRKPPKSIEYNPVIEPSRAHGYEGVRWVENVSDMDDAEDFRGFCRNATAAQLIQIYRKEIKAGRTGYAVIAKWVAEERGITLAELLDGLDG